METTIYEKKTVWSTESNPVVEVLLCTIDEGIHSVIELVLPQLQSTLVTISHQVTEESWIAEFHWPDNVQYVIMSETGLSKNRNNALRHARGDVCLIGDDDIQYLRSAITDILTAYHSFPHAAVITFQSAGNHRWKKVFAHNARTILQVSSCTITFKREWVIKNQIVFDEKFGLGSSYPQGEENIFLADIRKKGGKIIACPEVIVDHDGQSSGYLFTKERTIGKIAAVRRMYGRSIALVVLCIFSVTKYKLYSKQGITYLGFLRYGSTALLGKL